MEQTKEKKPSLKGYNERTIKQVRAKKTFGGWEAEEKYDILVVGMANGRYAIYKESRSANLGYNTYDTLEDLKQDFEIL